MDTAPLDLEDAAVVVDAMSYAVQNDLNADDWQGRLRRQAEGVRRVLVGDRITGSFLEPAECDLDVVDAFRGWLAAQPEPKDLAGWPD